MYGRFGIHVVLPLVKLVVRTAEIIWGAILPIELVFYLHFEIDDGALVHIYIDVQNEFFVIYRFAELNRICDYNGRDIFRFKM